jgi:hypothetical protein
MAETDTAAGPLAFAATFPPEERFAATAAELAARLAVSAGCSPAAAEELRAAVDGAFRRVLASSRDARAAIDLTLKTADGVFDADLAAGGVGVFHCSRPRVA